MSGKGTVPMEVLSSQLAEAIAGRPVRSAVFTTFTFDPGFFELHVLPVLFDQPFSQVDKVRRVQLEDALRGVDHLAVYYDRDALSQDAEPAFLDFRRVDVRRATGRFHPKVALLLVEEPADAEDEKGSVRHQSLVVMVSSANLTRAGWWENIECAHVEEIKDRELAEERQAWRKDLLSLVRRVWDAAGEGEDQPALGAIRDFLLSRAEREQPARASYGGKYHTRLFVGQGGESFSGWLSGLGIGRREWNLEIISPYFDPRGAGPLKALVDAIGPRETRVFLPRESDGTAGAGEATFNAVIEVPGCSWARLPSDISERGRGSQGEKLQPRRVHAKVYRLWHYGERRDLLVVGSVNLTGAAHSHGGAGNLEAAFLVDVSDDGYPRRWWLETDERAPERFLEQSPAEEDGLEPAPIDLSLRYDWGARKLFYRYGGQDRSGFEVCETSGKSLFKVASPRGDSWVECGPEAATAARQALGSSSFFLVKHPKGEWRMLVREENMGHRPSLLTELTPEEILEYWSLLTPEQRAAYIEWRAGLGETDEGLPVVGRKGLESRDTLFDRFAGVFHAFGCLRRHVEEAIEAGRDAEAETRLAGAKYDSLPMLLEKVLKREGGDPVVNYVTFLCALQVRRSLRKKHREFFKEHRTGLLGLDAQLARLAEVRKAVPLPGTDGRKYLDWFEGMFLKEL